MFRTFSSILNRNWNKEWQTKYVCSMITVKQIQNLWFNFERTLWYGKQYYVWSAIKFLELCYNMLKSTALDLKIISC